MTTHAGAAVVTGAARGMGRAITARLAALGYPVIAVDIDEEGLATTAAEVPGDITPLVAGVGAADAPSLVRTATRPHGGICVLVNNAGISPKRDGVAVPTVELTRAEWDRVLLTNLTGAFELCQVAAIDMMAMGWGRIVNVSSLAARTGTRVPGSHYVASKAALLGFSRTLALELGRSGVTVNCIAPGRIDTSMAGEALPEINERMLRRVPVGRFGQPDDIAAAVAYLVSEDAGFVTGATLDVNGGMLMI